MFLEVKIRKDGQEKWVDARKFFDYMIKEYSKVSYKGKSVDPYPDRVNKFYDDIPKDLIDMWKKAYPNLDVKAECERARAWLLTNTNKAKTNFKAYTNRWLGNASNNGGSTAFSVDKVYDFYGRLNDSISCRTNTSRNEKLRQSRFITELKIRYH